MLRGKLISQKGKSKVSWDVEISQLLRQNQELSWEKEAGDQSLTILPAYLDHRPGWSLHVNSCFWLRVCSPCLYVDLWLQVDDNDFRDSGDIRVGSPDSRHTNQDFVVTSDLDCWYYRRDSPGRPCQDERGSVVVLGPPTASSLDW